ncbi:MAG: hypothetical protein ACRC3Y_12460 [Romboutsia sp.]|uniref:hypothetical protein n=1 Tax=Romboutsia sp. TaxID=1965302 RepID=UPI003F3AF6B9
MIINNASFGMSVQEYICNKYDLQVNDHARDQFKANQMGLSIEVIKTIEDVFKELGDIPIQCTTFEKSLKKGESTKPYNFILKSGKTLAIKTNKNKSYKVCPNIVGQAGYQKLNYHLGHLTKQPIQSQEDIKDLVYDKIDKLLPIFIDYMFISDITVWIYFNKDGEVQYKIIKREEAPDLIFKRDNLYFTREGMNWVESTTLKHKSLDGKKDLSLAEIQVHSNRTFKFRFDMDKIVNLLKKISHNTETLGMSAEKAICDLFDLEREHHLNARSSRDLEVELKPVLIEAFKVLPDAIEHSGSKSGERGSQSKSSYDFVLEGNKTLSLKTNYGKMVCPPEVGQPSQKTFLHYFGDLMNEEFSEESFKRLVLEDVNKMIPRYLSHLLDSDYLLWIYKEKDGFTYKILNAVDTTNINWKKEEFSFTRNTLETWNESTTLKYRGISLGEFQVHRSRNSYKFRFNMKNLLRLLEMEGINLE